MTEHHKKRLAEEECHQRAEAANLSAYPLWYAPTMSAKAWLNQLRARSDCSGAADAHICSVTEAASGDFDKHLRIAHGVRPEVWVTMPEELLPIHYHRADFRGAFAGVDGRLQLLRYLHALVAADPQCPEVAI